jgi:hypothetical protein
MLSYEPSQLLFYRTCNMFNIQWQSILAIIHLEYGSFPSQHHSILWHVDPLLSSDHEISTYAIAVAR